MAKSVNPIDLKIIDYIVEQSRPKGRRVKADEVSKALGLGIYGPHASRDVGAVVNSDKMQEYSREKYDELIVSSHEGYFVCRTAEDFEEYDQMMIAKENGIKRTRLEKRDWFFNKKLKKQEPVGPGAFRELGLLDN